MLKLNFRSKKTFVFIIIIILLAVRYFFRNTYPELKPYYSVKGRIVFESDRIRDSRNIFILEDKKIQKLIKSANPPSFSPDGRQIVFEDSYNNLSILFLEEGVVKKIKNCKTSSLSKPLWSNDGYSIYFERGLYQKGDALYKVDLLSGEVTTLIDFDRKLSIIGIRNYKDEKLFFNTLKSDKHSEGIWELFELDLRDKTVKKIKTQASVQDFDISHDGTKIVFTSMRDSNGEPVEYTEIFVMDIDGANIKRLTYNKWQEKNPCWSPDDKQICFTGLRYFNPIAGGELYVINADGTNEKRITPVKKVYGFGFWSTDEHPDWHN